MVLITVILAWLGLAAGSFVNALVWRLHEQGKEQGTRNKKQETRSNKQVKKTSSSFQVSGSDLSVISGRSMCPNCRHLLAWYDLIPLFSWLMLRGKCRYCGKSISTQYPIVELTSGLVFVLSYIFWPYTVHLNGQWILLATWLVASVGLLALAVYDLRWMLLPNKIIYPTLLVAVLGRLAYLIAFENRPLHALVLWAASLLVASGIFYIMFEVSQGKWIGFGDVRLGLITGTLLASPQKSLLMIFLASLLGTLAAVPSLLSGGKTLASRLPYGPFLIVSTAIVVLFGGSLLNHYASLMGLH